MQFPRVARFRTVADIRAHCESLGAPIPFDDTPLSAAEGSPLAAPLPLGPRMAGNRWCIHPMEGWDATDDGRPTDTLLRRWRHFGESGAKLIWGGEAVAVLAEGRANPNQLCAPACGRDGFAALLQTAREAHAERFGATDDLIVALQLTHSGRFSKPTPAGRQPRIAYHHPLLDARHGVDPSDTACLLTDADVEHLIDAYLAAARDAEAAGFDMVDIKACHGYLLHEFLSARRRPGPYGGDFAGRTRLLQTIIERVRETCPRLLVGVRLSLFDVVPWHKVGDHGEPFPFAEALPYDCGFGVSETDPMQMDLDEPIQLLKMLRDLGVCSVNLSAGSPYTVPHIQRPAAFPHPTATHHQRIRLWGCGGSSTPAGRPRRRCPTCRWSARGTPIFKTISCMRPRRPCGQAGSMRWGSGGWCSPTRISPPIRWRAHPSCERRFAEHSPTAPPLLAMASAAAATRSTTTTRPSPRRPK